MIGQGYEIHNNLGFKISFRPQIIYVLCFMCIVRKEHISACEFNNSFQWQAFIKYLMHVQCYASREWKYKDK